MTMGEWLYVLPPYGVYNVLDISRYAFGAVYRRKYLFMCLHYYCNDDYWI
jgi:hypothetical protein